MQLSGFAAPIGVHPQHDDELSLALTGRAAAAFGSSVIVTRVSDRTWESDLFPAVDLGDGIHDYRFKLVAMPGKGGVVTLEDET